MTQRPDGLRASNSARTSSRDLFCWRDVLSIKPSIRSVLNWPATDHLWSQYACHLPCDPPQNRQPERVPLDNLNCGIGDFTEPDVMFTIRPNLWSIIGSIMAFISSMAVSMLASRALIQSSRVQSQSPGVGHLHYSQEYQHG